MNENGKEESFKNLCERGVSAIYPNRAFLESKLRSGEKLNFYCGIDPTGPTLHLGHAIQLKKLSELQSLGHSIILLIGDFTATIGDPSGKLSARKTLTRDEVLSNAKLYKKQASKWLKFTGENKAVVKYNSKWLSKMNLGDFSRLAMSVTVDQLLERDMFQKRKNEGKPIYMHEFFYPILQGYDSVAMGVDGEVGGNDQTFNMLMGRTLSKIITGKEKIVIATKLLEDNLGNKMGKTEGNMVALSDDVGEMFGKIMSWTDSLIIPGMELCTKLTIEKISQIKAKLEGGLNPRDAKLILAEEVVAVYHGRGKAVSAKKSFLGAFSEDKVPNDVPTIEVSGGSLLVDALVPSLVVSKTDFRRLVSGGAIKKMESGEKIVDPMYSLVEPGTFKIGKHRFVKISLK